MVTIVIVVMIVVLVAIIPIMHGMLYSYYAKTYVSKRCRSRACVFAGDIDWLQQDLLWW